MAAVHLSHVYADSKYTLCGSPQWKINGQIRTIFCATVYFNSISNRIDHASMNTNRNPAFFSAEKPPTAIGESITGTQSFCADPNIYIDCHQHHHHHHRCHVDACRHID